MDLYEPLVSIVIPAYNASNYLSKAIDSALNQTYKNIEVLVVNDGSKDNGKTEQIALSYGNKIRYFSKENGGSSSALNKGIKEMDGEWFSWLSHDDLYYPNKIEEEILLMRKMIAGGISEEDLCNYLFFGAANLIDGQGKIIKRESKRNLEKTNKKINCPNGTLNLIAIPTQDGFHGCSCMVHKKAFAKVGFFDESLRLLNDMDIWFRFYTSGYTVKFIPEVLVCGRVHASQVSRSIGFSYHNSEQDMFWNRSLEWLLINHSDNFKLINKFGLKAIEKTRYKEGWRAYNHNLRMHPIRSLLSVFRYIAIFLYSIFRNVAKQIYLKVRA